MLLSPDASTRPDEQGSAIGASSGDSHQTRNLGNASSRDRSASVTSTGHGARSGDSPSATENRAHHSGSAPDTENNGDAMIHARTYSNSSRMTHSQTPPYSPPFRSNTGSAHITRRSSAADGTPPSIRQTHTDQHTSPRRNHDKDAGSESASKNSYLLWMPWEETALVDWLYKPENCKLFNIPRRKKECHERIIQEILPNKTSRAIEGKIRTLEKRYQKTAFDMQHPDYAAKNSGKRPEEVAEALCNNFYKLEAVFNPAQAQARSVLHRDPHGGKKVWGAVLPTSDGVAGSTSAAPVDHGLHQSATLLPAGIPITAGTLVNTGIPATAGSNTGVQVSVPRSTSPPRIAMAESLPVSYKQARKIAPKRGTEVSADTEADGPVMMSNNKRSRTLPSILQNRRSPGRQLTPLQQQHRQRSPLLLQQITQQQQQQQLHQRMYENGARYMLDATGRPTTATLPMSHMPMHSPASASAQPSMSAHPRHLALPNTALPDTTQGTREELDWLQFNLRREELEFRKLMFVHDQELETKRVKLEEQRLENQRRETELESKRLDVQRMQLDTQIESLKSVTSMLGQMVSQMGSQMHNVSEHSSTHAQPR
ncbi:hypothetical protein IWW56_003836 [Coemansia sp. RSA 2131]|nr:hypothetical protein IWW56_003836 [Coemansia sp. RSA 2131]